MARRLASARALTEAATSADGGSHAAPPGQGLSCRSMDLKGAEPANLLGLTLKILYDEGGPSPVPYVGLVVYAEASRCAGAFAPPGPGYHL